MLCRRKSRGRDVMQQIRAVCSKYMWCLEHQYFLITTMLWWWNTPLHGSNVRVVRFEDEHAVWSHSVDWLCFLGLLFLRLTGFGVLTVDWRRSGGEEKEDEVRTGERRRRRGQLNYGDYFNRWHGWILHKMNCGSNNLPWSHDSATAWAISHLICIQRNSYWWVWLIYTNFLK